MTPFRRSRPSARDFLEDGRGSTVQEATPSGSVASWRAYSASGALSAGSDAAERPFFGYNGEMQDAATGLVYMRARHYDAASGRFGSADSVLGSLADPVSLNRYLYCGADPVNFCDPTGHARVVSYKPKGRPKKSTFPGFDPAAQSGQANLDPVWRDFNMLSGALQMHTTAYGARKAAYGNTVRLNNEKADLIEGKYGWTARQAFSAKVARNFKVHVERYYCGSNEHLKDFAGDMHMFAQDYWYLPVAPTLADWCAYVAEGDVQNTVLYSVLSLFDVCTVGGGSGVKVLGSFGVKAGSKLSFGSGFSKAANASAKGIKIGDRYVNSAPEAAEVIFNAERKGSALEKSDDFHYAASFLSKEELSKGKIFAIDEGKTVLLQVKSDFNNRSGLFEYILESDGRVSHQRFKEAADYDGKVN